jgi:hypothetical protein
MINLMFVYFELEWQGKAEKEVGIVKAFNKEKVGGIKEKVSKTTFNYSLFP